MMDFSMRIVAAAARLLPYERSDWGAAMKAELAQIGDAPSRLRFALGCAHAAVFAPRQPETTAGIATLAVFLGAIGAAIGATWRAWTTHTQRAR